MTEIISIVVLLLIVKSRLVWLTPKVYIPSVLPESSIKSMVTICSTDGSLKTNSTSITSPSIPSSSQIIQSVDPISEQ